MRYADQTNCEAALVQFPDGPERWTIFKEGEPILAFPVYQGDIAHALQFHDFTRLKMRKPAELAKELEQEREERRARLRRLGKRPKVSSDENEENEAAHEKDADVM